MRLEIAVGERPTLLGDDVIYCDARAVDAKPLVVCDVFGTLPFADGQFALIQANHILEHCSHRRTLDVLQEWRRLLAAGGVLRVEVPNLKYQLRILAINPADKEAVILMFGGQDMPNDLNTHRNGFTKELLRAAFLHSGFSRNAIDDVGGVLVGTAWN